MSHKHSFSLGGGGHSVTSDIVEGGQSERDPEIEVLTRSVFSETRKLI